MLNGYIPAELWERPPDHNVTPRLTGPATRVDLGTTRLLFCLTQVSLMYRRRRSIRLYKGPPSDLVIPALHTAQHVCFSSTRFIC